MGPLNLLSSVLDFAGGAQGAALASPLAAIRAPGGLPPSIQTFLFESQWAWWTSLIAASIAARFVGRRRAERRLILAGWAIFGLTALWMVTATLVVTPRERLQLAHKALAAAAGNHDIATIASYLAPDFQSPNLDISRRAAAEEEIRERLKTYGIKGNTILRFHSQMRPGGDEADTEIVVLTTTDSIGSVQTTWELVWVDVPAEDWRIRHAEMTKIGDQPVGPEHIIPK
jgi:hypothetical protein